MKDNAVKSARWALFKTSDQFTPKKLEQRAVVVVDHAKQVEVYADKTAVPVSQQKIQQPLPINPAFNRRKSWIADAAIAVSKIIEASVVRGPIKYIRKNTIE